LSTRHQLGNPRENSLREWLHSNATSCSVYTPEIRTLPELRRTDYVRLDAPAWYAPDPIPGLVPEESSQMKEDLPAAIRELDDINTRLATRLRSLDVDTLFHTRHSTLLQGHQTPWYVDCTTISLPWPYSWRLATYYGSTFNDCCVISLTTRHTSRTKHPRFLLEPMCPSMPRSN